MILHERLVPQPVTWATASRGLLIIITQWMLIPTVNLLAIPEYEQVLENMKKEIN